MALSLDVQINNIEKITILRNEILKLQQQLYSLNSLQSPDVAKGICKQLSELTDSYRNAAKQMGDSAGMAKNQLEDFNSKLDEAQNKTRDTSVSVGTLVKAGAAFLTVNAAKGFISSMMSARNEIQSLEKAFTSLLGSEQKSAELFGEIKEFGLKTPMELGDLAKGAQMLLSFNIAAEDVMPTLKSMADIAMGDTGKFNSLTLAFSQMSATGKLMGQDLNQMINAGFNPLQEMSRTTGKSISELKEEMSKGSISSKMVADAFKSATAEGGKFYGMVNKQSETISGQMSNLQDGISNMFAELGASSEGIIMSGIGGVATLVENYKSIGMVIVPLITTLGVLKTAFIVQEAITQAATAANVAHATSQGVVKNALILTRLNVNKLTAAMMANPIIAITAAVLGLVTALIWYNKVCSESAKNTSGMNDQLERQNKIMDARQKKSKELIQTMKDETKSAAEQQLAYEKLIKMYPSLLTKYDSLQKAQTGLKESEIANVIANENQIVQKTALQSGLRQQKEFNEIAKAVAAYKKDSKLKMTEDFEYYENQKNKTPSDYNSNLTAVTANGRISFSYTDLNGQVKTVSHSMKEFNEMQKEHSKSLTELSKNVKAFDDATQKTEASKAKNLAAEQQQALENLKNAQQKLNEIKSNAKKYTTDDFEKAKKDLEDAQSAAKKLGVDTDKKTSTNKNDNSDKLKSLREEIRKENEDAASRNEISEKNGFEQQEAQIKRDGERLLQQIAEKGKELRKLQNGILSESDNNLLKIATENAQKETNLKLQKLYMEGLDSLEGYMNKRDAVISDAAKKTSNNNAMLKSGAISKEQYAANQKEIEYQKDISLDSINLEFAEREQNFKNWMSEIAEYSLDELNDALNKAKTLLEKAQKDNPNDESTAVAAAKVAQLQKEISTKKVNQSPDKRTLKDWAELQKVISKVGGQFDELGEQIGGAAGEALKTVGSISGTVMSIVNSLVSYASISSHSIDGVSKTTATAIKTVEKASVILAIIGAAIQLATAVVNIFKDDNSLLKEIIADVKKINREIENTRRELELSKAGEMGIFATDNWQRISTSIEIANDSLTKFNESVSQMRENDKVLTESKIFSYQSGVTNYFSANRDISNEDYLSDKIGNMTIKTKKAKHFLGVKTKSAKYANLKDLGLNLWDENGKLSMDNLQSFMESDTFNKLSDENKEFIQNLADNWKVYQDATEQVKESIADIFSDVPNSFMDNIIDAFDNGTSAADAFKDSVANSFRELIKQMVYNAYFADTFKNLSDDIQNTVVESQKNGLTPEQTSKKVAEVASGYAVSIQNQMEGAEATYNALNDAFANNGFDLSNNKIDQTATFGGYETMSEETGTELSGRFSALQITGQEINNLNKQQADLLIGLGAKVGDVITSVTNTYNVIDETRTILSQSYLELQSIQENTSKLVTQNISLFEKIKKIEVNTQKI